MKNFYIIDLGYGNLQSLIRFFGQFGDVTVIDCPPPISSLTDNYSIFILPGVGSFYEASKSLERSGFNVFLRSIFGESNTLIIGICLGMQLFASHGLEGGHSRGLNLIPGDVVPVSSSSETVMGWQPLSNVDISLINLPPFNLYTPFFYFAHSYKFILSDLSTCFGYSDYLRYPAIVSSRNIVGFQFHPELSQRAGFLLVSSLLTRFFE